MGNQILQPSCISFESALSHHQLIPEAVRTITSSHPLRKTKIYQTPFGHFTYRYVPCRPFFLFVAREPQADNTYALIAHPLRALYDWSYVGRHKHQTLVGLEKDLRLDVETLGQSLAQSSVGEMIRLAESYKKKNILDLNALIMKEFK